VHLEPPAIGLPSVNWRGKATSSMMINSQPEMERLFFTVPEVAEKMAVCQKTVLRLIDRGYLKSSSALRHKRISKQSLDEFVKQTAK